MTNKTMIRLWIFSNCVVLVCGLILISRPRREQPKPLPPSVWFRITNENGMTLTLEVPRELYRIDYVTNRPAPPGGLRAKP